MTGIQRRYKKRKKINCRKFPLCKLRQFFLILILTLANEIPSIAASCSGDLVSSCASRSTWKLPSCSNLSAVNSGCNPSRNFITVTAISVQSQPLQYMVQSLRNVVCFLSGSNVFSLVCRTAVTPSHLRYAGPDSSGTPYIGRNMAGHRGQTAGDGPHLPGGVPVQGNWHSSGPGSTQAQQTVQIQRGIQSAGRGATLLSGEEDQSQGGQAGPTDEQDRVHCEQDQQAAEGPGLGPVG